MITNLFFLKLENNQKIKASQINKGISNSFKISLLKIKHVFKNSS